jgi:hypothetical protein
MTFYHSPVAPRPPELPPPKENGCLNRDFKDSIRDVMNSLKSSKKDGEEEPPQLAGGI